MARMYPQQLPEYVESGAERLLYDLLAARLPDDFVVMHGVKWLLRDRRRHDQDGEIDFLIAHPRLGLLVLEVKGGRMRVDGTSGQWFTVNRFDEEFPLKTNPFDQAMKSLYALKAKLEEAPATRPFRYRLERGVALPDVVAGDGDIGLFGPRGLIIDSTDLYQIEAAVRRIMGTPDPREHLSKAALDALIETLQPTREIRQLGLGSQVLQAEEQIRRLTEEQFQVLDFLRNHPQAAIAGCAGSGKTMLAIEKARRLANEGFQVLFTCYNKNLAHWLREQVARDPSVPEERIRVAHYHGLVTELCEQAEIALPPMPDEAEQRSAYFAELLPDLLSQAIERLPERFDAIIADEGQDFQELWWMTLHDLLVDRERGVFYVFYDDNQLIYTDQVHLPHPVHPVTLRGNCRNTTRIHECVVRYHRGVEKPQALGPDGPAPEHVPVEPGGELRALRGVFARLFTQERIPPRDVVILTPRGPSTSVFTEGAHVGNLTLTWNEPGANQVRVSSIYGFKGLESSVVVLAELDRIFQSRRQDSLLYVATSRARNHLVVLGDLPEPVSAAQ